VKVGLCGANVGACADPEVMQRVAVAADEAGLDSIWVSEHHVVPDPKRPPSGIDPAFPLLDPIVSLSHIAAVTTRVRLGTGVIVLPLRSPLVLAKQLASLDVLSRGRVIFGIGVGYVEQEFAALDVPFEDRGERTTEYLEAIRAIWTENRRSYVGRLYSFADVSARPMPIQRPAPPVVIGGASRAAMRRAVRSASGWFGWGYDVEEATAAVNILRELLDVESRDSSLGDFEITIGAHGEVTPGEAGRYAEAGVDRLNLILPTGSGADAVYASTAAAARLAASMGTDRAEEES
jgi:probable F420-dependent oxidoreductase